MTSTKLSKNISGFKRVAAIQIIYVLLAFLFSYAGASKLIGFSTFQVQLSQSPYISRSAYSIARILPVFELLLAASFAFSALRLYALYTSLFLLTLFSAYLLAMLNFSYYIPCSCGGLLSILTWKQHVVFNTFFIALSLTAIGLTSINQRAINISFHD